MVKRIQPDRCCGAIIDVQDFFLTQIENRLVRSRVQKGMANFARLLGYFHIPIVVTLERPVDSKGSLPAAIERALSEGVEIFEKDTFDLTREPKVRNYLAHLKKKQIVVAGCETDVCILHSCLGLIDLGYEVYVVEDLLFSSARDVTAATARMRAEGAVLLTYKTLYYELLEAVDGGPHAEKMQKTFGPFPDDLPDV